MFTPGLASVGNVRAVILGPSSPCGSRAVSLPWMLLMPPAGPQSSCTLSKAWSQYVKSPRQRWTDWPPKAEAGSGTEALTHLPEDPLTVLPSVPRIKMSTSSTISSLLQRNLALPFWQGAWFQQDVTCVSCGPEAVACGPPELAPKVNHVLSFQPPS